MNAQSFSVVKKNEAVITFLKGRVPTNDVNWEQIKITNQELKELVHEFCESVCLFQQHSGRECPDATRMRSFVTELVVGFIFSDQIKVHKKQKLVCKES